MKKPIEVPCPTCGKKTPWETNQPFRPFCTERCRLIDLGEWASEGYRVAGDPIPHDSSPEDDKEGN